MHTVCWYPVSDEELKKKKIMFRDFFSFLQSSLQNGTTTKNNVAE
jgi:hypothetical protein